MNSEKREHIFVIEISTCYRYRYGDTDGSVSVKNCEIFMRGWPVKCMG